MENTTSFFSSWDEGLSKVGGILSFNRGLPSIAEQFSYLWLVVVLVCFGEQKVSNMIVVVYRAIEDYVPTSLLMHVVACLTCVSQ